MDYQLAHDKFSLFMAAYFCTLGAYNGIRKDLKADYCA
jgi:hypothetical protein